ncbi:MAG: VTC domain-containing protein, partial [Proteobacteria bacterium]|nr:VTC domain-containing protein [Pseudomonadota bacterium]
MSDTAFTNRYEIKYLVRMQRLEEIRDALSGFFEPDDHAGPSGGYYNYSIYFDSPHYDFYSEKREGNLIRIKPRIRLYRSEPGAPASNFYLELKGRYDRIVLKRRDRITRDIAETLLSSGPAALTDRDLESSVLGEFVYFQNKLNLSPCVTIRYRREP